MTKSNYILLFWLSAVSLIAGYRTVISSDVSARLKSQYNLKVCGTESQKEVIITLGIGPVLKTDSLISFDFLVKYDPKRIQMLGPIYMNTISEFTKYKGVNIGFDSNMIRAFAFTDVPFSGNQELIGFSAKLLDNCSEPLEFSIVDFEITDDYKKSFSVESTLTVIPEKVLDINKKVEINLDRNQIVFEKQKEEEIIASLRINPYIDIQNIIFDIYIDNDIFDIKDVLSVNDNITIDYLSRVNEHKYELKLNIFDNVNESSSIKLIIKEKNKQNTDVESKLIINPRKYEFCNCFSEFKSDTLNLISKAGDDSTTNTINDNNQNFEITVNDESIIILNNSNIMISSLVLYDYLGNVIQTYNINNNNSVIINKYYDIKPGVYFVKITNGKFNMNKSILIYN